MSARGASAPCVECKRQMVVVRPGQEVPAGFVRKKGRGLCGTCYDRALRNGRVEKFTRVNAEPGAHEEARQGVDDARRALEAWLLERRARGVPSDGLVAA